MDSTGAMALPDAADTSIARTHEVLEFSVPSRPRLVSAIRYRVRKFARSMPFTPDQLDDISIAIGEAGANAVKYGSDPLGQHAIKVRAERSTGALRILISDSGPGFDPSKVCAPGIGDLCECGRGIMCMCSLMDEVVFHPLSPGTCVEMVKQVRPVNIQ